VYRETIDRIVGMMHVQDLLARIVDGRPVSMADIRPVPYLPESATLNAVLEAMRKGKTQLCVVLDEYGGTEGIITLTDLFHEVAGKIPEGAVQKGEIHYDRDGVLMVAGTVRVEEVGETLKLRLRHEEVDTVSGLVLTLLGAPPQPGDRVDFQGLTFEVMDVEGRGVKWCAVTRNTRSEQGKPSDG
jgi:CBS domain containing-hemolysin-like protein